MRRSMLGLGREALCACCGRNTEHFPWGPVVCADCASRGRSPVPDSLRAAWRFFQENAGYCTPPGRAMCALQLARAEAAGLARGWSAAWVEDDDPDLSWVVQWADKKTQKKVEDGTLLVQGCCLMDEEGNTIASLWGITEADDDYRRVVEAELMQEALPDLPGAYYRLIETMEEAT